jgi:hypothetical protein
MRLHRVVFKAQNILGDAQERLWAEVQEFANALQDLGGFVNSVQDRSDDMAAVFVLFYDAVPEVAADLPRQIEQRRTRSKQPSVQNIPKPEKRS